MFRAMEGDGTLILHHGELPPTRIAHAMHAAMFSIESVMPECYRA
jgi:hypothetical protein